MSIDPGMVARRRHTARTFVRAAALVLFAVAAFRLIWVLEQVVSLGSRMGAGSLFSGEVLVAVAMAWLPWPAAGVALLYFERRLVNWLIPPPSRGRCPACDYDVRYTTGDRCPECGLDLQRGA